MSIPDRKDIKTDIAATLRVIGRAGLDFGLAGHVTVRHPDSPEHFYVNPLGVLFTSVRASDIVLIDQQGEIVEGRHQASGFQSQLAIHAHRPELTAALHTHSFYGFAWSNNGRVLDALNTESAGIHRLIAHRDSFDVPVEDALGETARILVQRFHGFITAGETLAEAGYYFLTAERAAKTQLLLEAAGRIGDAVPAEVVERWTLTPQIADRQFRAYAEQEIARDPSIAD